MRDLRRVKTFIVAITLILSVMVSLWGECTQAEVATVTSAASVNLLTGNKTIKLVKGEK